MACVKYHLRRELVATELRLDAAFLPVVIHYGTHGCSSSVERQYASDAVAD